MSRSAKILESERCFLNQQDDDRLNLPAASLCKNINFETGGCKEELVQCMTLQDVLDKHNIMTFYK